MRILFVIDSLGGGGAEYSNAYLWYFLLEKKIPFKVVVWERDKVGIEQEVLTRGIEVKFLKRGFFLNNARQLATVIKNYKPTLVHSVLFYSNIRARFARLFASFVHLESLVNHMYDPSRLNDPHITWFKLKAYQVVDGFTQKLFVDHFHANGQSVKAHYVKSLNINSSKIKVINRGRPVPLKIDREKVRQDFLLRFSLPHDCFILINVGRQEYQKGQDILISSLKYLNAGKPVLLLLVGRDGNLTSRIDALLKSESCDVSVLRLGHRHDVDELLQLADLFVFPSRFEGFPGALIEAEAASLPIVCSDIVMNLEVVDPNKNALLFKPEDPKDLSRCIQQLADEESKRVKFAEESKRIFESRFRIDSVHEKMLNLYNDISA